MFFAYNNVGLSCPALQDVSVCAFVRFGILCCVAVQAVKYSVKVLIMRVPRSPMCMCVCVFTYNDVGLSCPALAVGKCVCVCVCVKVGICVVLLSTS